MYKNTKGEEVPFDQLAKEEQDQVYYNMVGKYDEMKKRHNDDNFTFFPNNNQFNYQNNQFQSNFMSKPNVFMQ